MKMQKLMGALILLLMLGAAPVAAQTMSDSGSPEISWG